MPELVNDWDKGFVVRWAVKCRRCGGTQKSDTPTTPEGWKEDTAPNSDGRITAYCPDCGK